MLYTLEPLDFALYRDGKPFTAEEFSRARPLGPVPMPRTVYGALRSLIMHNKEVPLDDFAAGIGELNGLRALLGNPDQTGDLQIRGPYLARETTDLELLLPYPADAFGFMAFDGIPVYRLANCRYVMTVPNQTFQAYCRSLHINAKRANACTVCRSTH